MAYDQGLAHRIESVFANPDDITPKNMFGGVAFFRNGNMSCGVHKDCLIVRVGPDAYEEALTAENVEMFDITGRPMKGWVMIRPEAIEDDDALSAWVSKGVAFAGTLPPK